VQILMISYEYPPLGGGVGVACAAVLSELSRWRGIRIDLVTSGPGPAQERIRFSPQVEIHKLPVGKKQFHQYWRSRELLQWTWNAVRYVDELVGRRRYDLCHCWGGWPSGFIGHRLRRQFPYVVALRGSDVPGYNKRLWLLDPLIFRHLSRRIWHDASRLLALSTALRALAWHTLPGAVIDILPNGVDTLRFAPGTARSPFMLLFAGRLIERKGVHHLIEAVARLSEGASSVRLVIAGDGPERARLQALVQRYGLEARVEFLGHLPKDCLAEVYRDASVLVVPSDTEALGNVVLEAMASGLAIITTRTGASELIDGNGQVIEAPNPASIKVAIERYLSSPELLTEHQRMSRMLAEAMSWESVARDLLAIWSEITERAPGSERSEPAPGRANVATHTEHLAKPQGVSQWSRGFDRP
jgi:glycosyltransferase involved in cell wall biosynthesis